MAVFYKGVRIGSFLHPTDLRLTGLTCRSPGAAASSTAIMSHVALGTTTSPHISLTRSYGVALDYAFNASRIRPTASHPAYVYEIDIPDPPPATLSLFDPVVEVAAGLAGPASAISYHHNGAQSLILGVADPLAMLPHRLAAAPCPPGTAPTSGPADLTREFETMVRALRDAEVLVFGNSPRANVIDRYGVFWIEGRRDGHDFDRSRPSSGVGTVVADQR